MIRLTADFWVRAYLKRLELAAIPAFVTSHGDPDAGAVAVKVATLDGKARVFHRAFDPASGGRVWMVLAEGEESAVDAVLARERQRDPDLWIVEIESRGGRHLLDEPGLDS